MSSELINTIENLNTRSFESYKFLSFEIREKIKHLINERQEENKNDKDDSDKNQQRLYLKQISLNYVIDKFNVKLLQYARTFFDNEELIRDVLQKNPSIKQELFDGYTFKYSYLLNISRFHELKLDEPTMGLKKINEKRGMDVMTSIAYIHKAEERFKSGYYLYPKPNKGSSSCFIATYAYNSSENDNVTFLRNYRDSVLLNSNFGKWFIRQYYNISPSIVNFFEQINFSKKLLRFLIGLIIKILRK